MDHVCSPLREMKGVFSFCHCLGLRIFPGNCFRLKSAFLLGCASSSPSSGAGPGQVSVASDSCVTSWARELCVCVCVCVRVCVHVCACAYVHACMCTWEWSGHERAVQSFFSKGAGGEKVPQKKKKRRKKKSCLFSCHSLILLAAFSCVCLP